MKQLIKKMLIFSFCLSLCVCCSDDSIFGTLEGKIIDGENNPLAGVSVLLVKTGEKQVTKEDGHYKFKKLDEALYEIYVSKPGYITDKASKYVLSGDPAYLDIILIKEE